MGNRATIAVETSTSKAVVYIYLHWNGSREQVIDVVKAAAPRMRKGDVSYATARLIGEFHDRMSGGLSLGVLPASENSREAYDNGHYTIDIGSGKITQEVMSMDNETWSGAVVAEGIEMGQF